MHRQEKNNEAHGMSGGGGLPSLLKHIKGVFSRSLKTRWLPGQRRQSSQKKKTKNRLMFKGGQVSEQLQFLTRRAKDRSFPVPLDPAVEEK